MAAAYKTQSTGILDTLEDMKDKAEDQLSSLRKAEVSSKHNYEMLKQSLEDEVAAGTKDMGDKNVIDIARFALSTSRRSFCSARWSWEMSFPCFFLKIFMKCSMTR